MNAENLKKANEVISTLLAQRKEKRAKLKETFARMIENSPVKNRRPPRDFNDSSYLLIRSYEGDDGTRPGANVAYWRSPDLNVSPLNSLNSYTTELNVGTLYNIKCIVRNRGDLIVPSAKVEFYLVTPSLGFDTRFAKKLGLTSTWVDCYSSAEVNIQYMIPPDDAGHRCLFARVFSFSPLDIPVYDTILNPRHDRHIGQQNLNIAAQSSQMQMNILHMPQAQLMVNFIPMNREEILALQHPSAKDFRIINNDRIHPFKMEFAEKTENARMQIKENTTYFEFNEEGKFNFEQQKRMHAQMQEINRLIHSGEARAEKFRKEIAEFRQMNLEHTTTPLNLFIPDLGLKKNEMTGFEIIATNNLNGEVFGGITLLVIG